jgi:phenylpropionate dioxygenase-like ring-hydroxylating dioxygenase large terminal subunit
MAVLPDVIPLADLVRETADTFEVHTDTYTSPAVFDAEMRTIFESGWVFVAHESQVREPGDYRTTSMGTQPVVVSRHEDGRLYVLLNRCRHRGTVVCRAETGHSNYFRCPYHNWSYANDGTLAGVAMADGWPEEFDKVAWGLKRVPRVDSYRGLVFASMAETGPSLAEHLAPIRRYVDAWFDRSPVGTITVLPTAHRYPYQGNWKWQAENGHDGYHGNYVHESWQRVLARAGEAPVRGSSTKCTWIVWVRKSSSPGPIRHQVRDFVLSPEWATEASSTTTESSRTRCAASWRRRNSPSPYVCDVTPRTNTRPFSMGSSVGR